MTEWLLKQLEGCDQLGGESDLDFLVRLSQQRGDLMELLEAYDTILERLYKNLMNKDSQNV